MNGGDHDFWPDFYEREYLMFIANHQDNFTHCKKTIAPLVNWSDRFMDFTPEILTDLQECEIQADAHIDTWAFSIVDFQSKFSAAWTILATALQSANNNTWNRLNCH